MMRTILTPWRLTAVAACVAIAFPSPWNAETNGHSQISQRLEETLVEIFYSDPQIHDYLSGHGFFVSPSGYILTAADCVRGAEKLRVRTFSGDIYDEVTILDDDPAGVAVLRILGFNLPYLELLDESDDHSNPTLFTFEPDWKRNRLKIKPMEAPKPFSPQNTTGNDGLSVKPSRATRGLPVLDSQNRVVAMLSSAHFKEATPQPAISVSLLSKILEEALSQDDKPSEDSSDASLPLGLDRVQADVMLDPLDLYARHRLCEEFLHARNVREADAAASGLADHPTPTARTFELLGRIKKTGGKIKEAISYYRKALALDANLETAYDQKNDGVRFDNIRLTYVSSREIGGALILGTDHVQFLSNLVGPKDDFSFTTPMSNIKRAKFNIEPAGKGENYQLSFYFLEKVTKRNYHCTVFFNRKDSATQVVTHLEESGVSLAKP
jgi:tetratricopeptide (TPR) repeat protein